jgi:DNA modification methylase
MAQIGIQESAVESWTGEQGQDTAAESGFASESLSPETPYFRDERVTVWGGDCLEVMPRLDAESFDAVITDPPYHLVETTKRFANEAAERKMTGQPGVYKRHSRGFMGQRWDGGDIAFRVETWREAYRVLKPGGHLIAFGGSRTWHRIASAIDEAGFEIRDSLVWLYGSGFPKSHDVSKGLDKQAGAKREVVGERRKAQSHAQTDGRFDTSAVYNGRAPDYGGVQRITAPATDAAKQWDGWGTALKPAMELICLARKPLVGTVAANVQRYGVGAINVDGCRVSGDGNTTRDRDAGNRSREQYRTGTTVGSHIPTNVGRWPANVCLDEEAAALLDEHSGDRPNPGSPGRQIAYPSKGVTGWADGKPQGPLYFDTGGASRFFYTAKASQAERQGATHPTVKPVSLMRWLCRLVTPPNGHILDPFAGTGTTRLAALAEGFRVTLIEQNPEYLEQLAGRVAHLALPLEVA